MLGYFNPTLGQIWTNSNNGLKMSFKKCNPMAGFVHIWSWVKTTQQFVECIY